MEFEHTPGKDMFHLVDSLGYPYFLAKACNDNKTSYLCKLKNGEMIFFKGAIAINKEWAVLESLSHDPYKERLPFGDNRPREIKVQEIVWMMEDPFGDNDLPMTDESKL